MDWKPLNLKLIQIRGNATEVFAWAGGEKAHLKSWDPWKFWTHDLNHFQRMHLSNTVLGAAGRHIPEKKFKHKYFQK